MVTSGLPTGTVSSQRKEQAPPGAPPAPRRPAQDAEPSPHVRELERENAALRAAIEQQRTENERIVERYEQLLERDQKRRRGGDTNREDRRQPTSDGGETGLFGRLGAALGLR